MFSLKYTFTFTLNKFVLISLLTLISVLHAAVPVANLKGNMGVSQGAFEYKVDLQLPPGIAGVVPKLSLAYNSNGGNGYLGLGWNLTGLSSITRCGSNLVEDGVNLPVKLDEQDHYCLDGQRLFPISEGSNEYRTKVEGYNRIKYDSATDTFKVWSKTGDIYTYGSSQNSKFIHENKTVSWKLSRIKDSLPNHDNTIDFTYNENKSINTINYARGMNRIEFVYDEARLDRTTSNFKGQVIEQNMRLKFIIIKVNDTQIRHYRLGYLDQESAYDKLKLSTLTECIGNECIQPLQFTWEENNTSAIRFTTQEGPYITNKSYKTKIADFNGDGISDIYRIQDNDDVLYLMNAQGEVEQTITVALDVKYDTIKLVDLNGDGCVDIADYIDGNRIISMNDGTGHFDNPNIFEGSISFKRFIDVDSDGDLDIVDHVNSTDGQKVWINDGSGNFEHNFKINIVPSSPYRISGYWEEYQPRAFNDIDGDGDMDFLVDVSVVKNYGESMESKSIVNVYRNEGNNNYTLLHENLTQYNSHPTHHPVRNFVDLNGDGVLDIIEEGSKIYLSDGNGGWVKNEETTGSALGENKFQVVDINGDGAQDILRLRDGSAQLYTNNGIGSFTWTGIQVFGSSMFQNIGSSFMNIDLIDINGDGFVDIIDKRILDYSPLTFGSIYINNGMGQFTQHDNSTLLRRQSGENYVDMLYGDFNGDGMTDAFDTYYGIHLNQQKQLQKIIAITDSFENVTSITYKPLTDPEVYTKEDTASGNVVDVQTPVMVVASTSVGDGVGGNHVKNYHYKGLKYHRKRGSLGFRIIEESDVATGGRTVMEFDQRYPLIGSLIKTEVFITPKDKPEEVLSESSIVPEILINQNGTWQPLTDLGSVPYPELGARYIIRNASQHNKSYINGVLLKEVDTYYDDYNNDYGNIKEMRTVTTGRGETFTKTTKSEYDNITFVNDDIWLPGRVTRTTVKHEAPGTDPITRTSEFTYDEDASFGMLETETIEPGHTLELTKTYEYDSFGNKVKETLSSPSFPKTDSERSTQYIYDNNGQFIKNIINALGHNEHHTYDQRTGKRLSLTGPNQLTTSWEYNLWGQKTKESRADGTFTTWEYRFDSYVNKSYYAIVQNDSSGATGTVYHDSFDREVAKKTIGFNDEEIFIKTIYNPKGQVHKKSSPHTENEDVEYIVYTYDDYGRVTHTRTPAPSNYDGITHVLTRAIYNGYSTKTIDAEGRIKIARKNAMDKIYMLTEGEGIEQTIRFYYYDAVGNLVKTDSNNEDAHRIKMFYDILGNKTQMIDPNMGVWNYTYDALGNLKTQTDAKGQQITINYDVLGRVVSKFTPEDTFRWKYDKGNKAIGKLTSERIVGGFYKNYSYDNFGRLKSTTTIIDGIEHTETFYYNAKSQLEKVVKPDNFEIINVYKENGYLEAIKSPRAEITDFNSTHYAQLISDQMEISIGHYNKYLEYKSEAIELRAQVAEYRALAQMHEDAQDYFENTADILEGYVQEYEAMAELNRGYAEEARGWADKYLAYALYLINMCNSVGLCYENPNIYFALADEYNTYVQEYEALVAEYTQNAETYMGYVEMQEGYAASSEQYIQDYLALAEETLVQLEAVKEDEAYYKRLAEQAGGDVSSAYNEVLMDSGHVYHYKVLDMDSYGRVTKYLSGNGLINTDVYEHSGTILSSHTGFHGDNAVRDLHYEYDKTYNVTKRVDTHLGLISDYTYDSFSRIRTASFSMTDEASAIDGLNNMVYDYDKNGNLAYKSDQGHYRYDTIHGNRLTKIVNDNEEEIKSFTYDDNGNMINNDGIKLDFNSANKVTRIEEGSIIIHFAYDMNNNRYKKTQGSKTTHYIGKSFEYIDNGNGTITQRHLIYANGKVVAINTDEYENGSATLSTLRYLHYDALGSVDTITDSAGIVVERRAYKPFGQELEVHKKDDAGFTTNRGFTGHEHIEGTRLIHMNARIYDPTIGRFLSADSIIQDPYDTQAFNRYSYARNNPLKYTDPSGHSWFSKLLKIIVMIIVAVVVYAVLGPGGTFLNQHLTWLVGVGFELPAVALGAAMGATMGFANTLLNGGGLKDALINAFKGAIFGAVSAGFAQGIGDWAGSFFEITKEAGHALSFFSGGSFQHALVKAAIHGVSRGILTAIQGGKFSAGFASVFITSAFAVGKGVFKSLGGNAVVARTAVMAMVGGVTSQITGGKFANGAITGAFVHLFNSENVGGDKKNNLILLNKEKDPYLYKQVMGMKFRDQFVIAAHGVDGMVSYSDYIGYDRLIEIVKSSGKLEILLVACDQGSTENFHFAQKLSNDTNMPVQYSVNIVTSLFNIPVSLPLFHGLSLNPWRYVYPQKN